MSRRGIVTIALLLAAPAAGAFPWSKDMVDQPAVKAQEAEVERPDGVVAVEPGDGVPAPASVAELVRLRLDAAATVKNPVAATDGSVARGKQIYQVHCLACHGADGTGDGPVGNKFVPPPMDLTTEYVRQQPDGQIFYTITHGSVVMPFYRDAIRATDRWHLINYLRREIKAP